MHYDLDKFETETGTIINEAKICISYLEDLGYIQGADINEHTHMIMTKLNGSGIQFVEEKKEQAELN